MPNVKNISGGFRGFYDANGDFLSLDPGEIVDADVNIANMPEEWFAEYKPLDRDNDGKDGGSLPYDPPALSNKSKAELLAIAEREGVEIEDGATIPDIKAAIELKREA